MSRSEPYETKSDAAYRQVRDRILAGELEPGAVIRQRELALRIGISTTPLREALRRLKSEGLVELDAHRDARVSPLRAEEARDLLEVRRSLDPLAAALAADRRTHEDIRALRAAAEELVPLPTRAGAEQLAAHRRFHSALYRASHNDLLTETLDGLWDKADRYRRLALRTDRGQAARDQKAREHEALVECVVRGDSARAADIMRRHIDTSLGATAVRQLGEPATGGGGSAAVEQAGTGAGAGAGTTGAGAGAGARTTGPRA
ncbi:GntR family transcriptional regulator [Streptomyces armeniacus]|uniref:GntR family transcriptional regulator n=1 Tax=Streptomyces armeniacus TaxID=83291 RepID=A0A345XTM5_9ACTN|nr:GntR family transcriptional regulator [Streptomyces armeniacus]AXK34991.1 GntR family transcriptional regulator [Streptomyces armeniacus]